VGKENKNHEIKVNISYKWQKFLKQVIESSKFTIDLIYWIADFQKQMFAHLFKGVGKIAKNIFVSASI